MYGPGTDGMTEINGMNETAADCQISPISVAKDRRLAENRFELGTFSPDPRTNSAAKMLAAQTKLELTLLLRNGEQLLLTMFIPITLLIGLCLLPIGDLGDSRVDTVLPGDRKSVV